MSALFLAKGLEADPENNALPAEAVSGSVARSARFTPDNRIGTPDSARALETCLLEILRTSKATGAAVALQVRDWLECVASSGESAPAAGTRCYPCDGLTGTCFVSGEMLVCNDTEDDARVVREACQRLGVRSVLVIPLREGSGTIGILEALSSEADAFDEGTISSIKRLAERIELPGAARAASISSSTQQVSTSFDQQELLEAAYVIQQQDRLLRAVEDHRATGGAYKIEPQDVNLSAAEEVKCFGSSDELSAVLSRISYTFRQKFPHAERYLALVAAAIFLAFLLGSYYLMPHNQISSSAESAKISGMVSGSNGNRSTLESDPPDGAPEPEGSGASHAQSNAGMQYPSDPAVPQSYASTMAAFEQTARKGDADAAWKLGVGYLRGIGVARDAIKAAEWFKKAANLGDVRAQSTLSELYFEGVGVPRDYVRAYTWASIAASEWGDRGERLKVIGERMTTAQLQNANRRAAAWFAQKSAANNRDHR